MAISSPRDKFYDGNFTAPMVDGISVTPADATPLADANGNPVQARYLYVGVAGDVTLITPLGTTLLFKNVPAGGYVWSEAAYVKATGTSATNIIAAI